jgi:hypothetical protein
MSSQTAAEIEASRLCDLKTAYLTVFSGVMACSPGRYTSGLMRVAVMAGRELDDQLRQEIRQIQVELGATEDS